MEYESILRSLFELKSVDVGIKKSSDCFTACAADFLRNHEFGHIVPHDEQFAGYLGRAKQEASRFDDFTNQDISNRNRIIQEVAPDISEINMVIGLYADRISGESIRNYLTFLTMGTVRMHVLYDLSADTHRADVDANFDVGDIDGRLVEWRIRESVMVSYIDGFVFGPDTVVPLAQDDLIPIDVQASGIAGITARDFAAKPDNNLRRLASLIASGFAPGAGFGDIIDGTRPVRVRDRPD